MNVEEIKRAPYCVQCTDETSRKIGSFLYDETKRANGEGLHAISPVFLSLADLFDYCKAEGIQAVWIN